MPLRAWEFNALRGTKHFTIRQSKRCSKTLTVINARPNFLKN